MFTDFFSKDEADKATGNAPPPISATVTDNSPAAVAARDAANLAAEADLKVKAAEVAKAQGAPVQHISGVFDPAQFPFADRVYRIHFKNGISGEYHGNALAHSFPFDPAEVSRVEHAENAGQ